MKDVVFKCRHALYRKDRMEVTKQINSNGIAFECFEEDESSLTLLSKKDVKNLIKSLKDMIDD